MSAPALLRAIDRLELARGVGVSDVDLSHVPANRLRELSAYAVTSKLSSLADLADDRRVATLLAFVRSAEAAACEDTLDILDLFMETAVRRATSTQQQSRLRSLRDLDEAALTLADLDATVLRHLGPVGAQEMEDPTHETAQGLERDEEQDVAPDATHHHWSAEELRIYLTEHREAMQGAIARIWDLARRPGETIQQELRSAYPAVRHFLPRLLRTIDFTATSGALPLTQARDFLLWLDQHPSKRGDDTVMHQAPLDFVPPGWRKYVCPPGRPIDRAMYTLCFVTQFHAALRAREIFAPASTRWSDPRTKLLQGTEWDAMRSQVAQLLHRSVNAEEELAAWESDLDAAYRQLASDLPEPVSIQKVMDPQTGKTQDRLQISGLEEQPDPVSLQRVRALIAHRLPVTDLSGVVMEMEARTHFAEEFTHIGGSPSRLADFTQSLSATLMAQACNLPISAVAQEYPQALAADRLVHVQQNYIRPETIALANARLVEYHRAIPLAALWGSGEVASADGLRFVVPVRTINAGPSSRYFGLERGVTLINYTLNHTKTAWVVVENIAQSPNS